MKNSRIYILLLIIILLIIGVVVFFGHNTNETIKVGNAEFTLPDGFTSNGLNSAGDLIIQNKKDSIYLKEYKTGNAESYMKNYLSNMNESNQSISTSNFKVGNVNVYKTTNDNTSSNHFWFTKNGKTYSVYTWEKTDNIDSIVFDLIKSMK